MITNILEPLVCKRFLSDIHYREGHLRVINALPTRRVMGLHTQEMKTVAKDLSKKYGKEIIGQFESTDKKTLYYEETVVWGYLINHEKCTLNERIPMLNHYIPILDNWAVCDSFCANAKWIARTDKEAMWNFLEQWFESEHEFEVRFAIVIMMTYFLEEEWLEHIFRRIDNLDFSNIKSNYTTTKKRALTPQAGTVQGNEPYYVRMGVAWLLATALAKFPEETKAYIKETQLPEDVIKLYIRKAKESFRTRNMDAL